MKALWSVPLLLALPFVFGCSGDDDNEDKPSVTPAPATSAPVAEASLTPTPVRATPFPTWPPVQDVPSTVWLIDVVSGHVTTLYDSYDVAAATAWFEEGSPVVATGYGQDGSQIISFDLEGNEKRREPTGIWRRCRETAEGAEVLGQLIEDVSCGPLSPDGSRMVFWTDAGEVTLSTGHRVPGRDLWVLELATARRILLGKALAACQGDSFFFPGWSPDGQYVHFGDCADGGRIFLGEAATGATRQIVAGILPTFGTEPSRAPDGDALLYADGTGGAVYEDLQAGVRTDLPEVRWPARFDPSGTYFLASVGANEPAETTVYAARTLGRVATLPGRAVGRLPFGTIMLEFVPVVAKDGGFVAALVEAPGCEGTVLYRDQARVACVGNAFGPSISPDGSRVVMSRLSGTTGPVQGPGFSSSSMNLYDIVLLDTQTGAETILARSALGGNQYPTPAVWDDAGTHLLVSMPFAYGP